MSLFPDSFISKDDFISKIRDICNGGWYENARPGNDGGVGNTMEDLLGIKENNLPIPNAAEWELKCYRAKSSSLTTLLHCEPSPRASKIVSSILLPNYGWEHKSAGIKYKSTELSFRQTINARSRTDRGFGIYVNYDAQRIEVSFDCNSVSDKHSGWLKSVDQRIGLNDLSPSPYWGFSDIFYLVATKLLNCFYIAAYSKKIEGHEHFSYFKIQMLKGLSQEQFIKAIENGIILVDFDARSGHNHGTKFRIRRDSFAPLYVSAETIYER